MKGRSVWSFLDHLINLNLTFKHYSKLTLRRGLWAPFHQILDCVPRRVLDQFRFVPVRQRFVAGKEVKTPSFHRLKYAHIRKGFTQCASH